MVYDPLEPVAAARPTILGDLPPTIGSGPAVRGGGGGAPGAQYGDAPHGMRRVLEWLLVIVVAAAVAFGMRTYVVGTYWIPSGSMEPTLMVHDRILVNKLSYDYHSVERGDIVVFADPPDEPPSSIKDLVKRVIGLPGETISSAPNGQVLINGNPIPEPWLTTSARLDPGPPVAKQKIPPGHYFLMGDNRGDSEDSRVFGPISASLIVGHTILRFWPLGSFHIF